MPWSALPEHLNSPDAWNGKDDDDHWYTKWRKSVKGYFAFGPRAKESWARFRERPITIVALKGPGAFRFENDSTAMGRYSSARGILWYKNDEWYLSRVQYWTGWHLQLQWPLFFEFHFREWQFYVGFSRDADRVYWFAVYPGRKWK